MPVEYDSNALDVTLNDPKHSEYAKWLQEYLMYVITQSKRSRSKDLLVKTAAYEILKKQHENEIIADHNNEPF